MIKIEGDFISLTAKVRTNGDSLIVGLKKDECKVGGIEKGSILQIFLRKLDVSKEEKVDAPTKELDYELEQMISQAKKARVKGMSIEQIKSSVNENVKFSYDDFPVEVRKQLEK